MTKTNEGVDVFFLRRIHGLLLTLYPREYLGEYGDELQTVFNLSLDGATGRFDVIMVFMHELAGIPKAIIYEHLRERRKLKMTGKFASHFNFTPGSWTESIAALAPFLLGMVMIIMSYIGNYINFPLWLQVVFVILFWSLALGLFLLGSIKGVPRWFLPYLGLPLPIISLIVFNSWLDDWNGFRFSRLYEHSVFLGQFVFQGLLWVGLIGSLLLFVLTVRLIPKFHSFHKRLTEDWTFLCFVLYGAMPFVLVLTFDEYKYDEPYMFLAFLILAAGGWFYLRNDELWKKFLCLYLGVALSMLITAVGKAIILPIQDWPVFIDPSYWKSEAMSTLIMWLWLALIMLIPPVLKLFQSSGKPVPAM